MVRTRGMVKRDTDEAVSKVFNIPELFELIVLNLIPKRILVIQRVSKSWQAAICSSPKLQRALGFTAVSKEAGWIPSRRIVLVSRTHAAMDYVKILRRSTRGLFGSLLLKSLCPPLKTDAFAEEYDKLLRKYARCSESLRNLSFDNKNGSLLRAYATQPPARKLKIWIYYHDRGGGEEVFESLEDFDLSMTICCEAHDIGIKVADVIKCVREHLPSAAGERMHFKMHNVED